MKEYEAKMQQTIESLKNRLISIRAGRANPAMLNGIMVNYYGVPTPIQSVANITVPEAKQLFIKPFDKSCLKEVEKSINEANLGIAPTNNGEMIILTIPDLTEDRRKEYVKMAKAMGEDAFAEKEKILYDINADEAKLNDNNKEHLEIIINDNKKKIGFLDEIIKKNEDNEKIIFYKQLLKSIAEIKDKEAVIKVKAEELKAKIETAEKEEE